jgi:Do/DeqQ family serine protease
MTNGYLRKTAVAGIAAAVVSMAAWGAPQATSLLTAASSAPVVETAPAGVVPSGVAAASYAPIVERVMPAVVTIRVEKRAAFVPTGQPQIPEELRRFFGDQLPQAPRGQRGPRGLQRGLGSGVIVSKDGYILTNNHVVDGSDKVKVEMPDRRTFTAKVVGTDPDTDLAVLKVDANDLPTLVIGDSDAVKVGDVAIAVGNPLDIGQTVTSGIISAKGRTTNGDGYQDFLQTDAAINRGNSGGALVNVAGQLIGINSQILSVSEGNIGLGFAIPSNMAKHVMDELVMNGKVRRAKLGVTVQRITPEMASTLGLANANGALISNVDDGSPAAKAGLKQGDVITQYNGKPVADNNQLRNAVASTTPGTTVPVQVLRNGKTETLQATVGELPATRDVTGAPTELKGEGRYGMTVQPTQKGLAVAELDPNGLAAESGLQPGDVIEKVNGKAVKSAEELRTSLDRGDGKASLVLVNRDGTSLFLTLPAR